MRLSESERIGLLHPSEAPEEWWVTLDGRPVVGFAGDTAEQRAAKYFLELTRIAERVRSTPKRPE
jgi:hypothetical protein